MVYLGFYWVSSLLRPWGGGFEKSRLVVSGLLFFECSLLLVHVGGFLFCVQSCLHVIESLRFFQGQGP